MPGITNEKKLTARLKQVSPEFIVFDLTIYDPTITGELILPPEQFRAFLQEQKVSIVTETEEDYILKLKLDSL
ncbi:MAG: hypothetical protein J0I20_00215 [Chloroflexi bacterium]|nr:hypothetical protein [Chloroflexota bacterium]OJW06797.1 MAG: hypothetical protein BGO39_23665 [Chloroflexi bacterium 54-19]